MDRFVDSAIFGAGATLGGRAMNSAIDGTKEALKSKPKPPPPKPPPLKPVHASSAVSPLDQDQQVPPVNSLPVYAEPVPVPSSSPIYPSQPHRFKRPVPVPPVPVHPASVTARIDNGPTREEFHNLMKKMESMELTIMTLQTQVDQLCNLLKPKPEHHEAEQRSVSFDSGSNPTRKYKYSHVATFPYDKRNQDELSIYKGERLMYIEDGRDSGWAFVKNEKGMQGLVPLNFLGPNQSM